jgi:hypothetical protein
MDLNDRVFKKKYEDPASDPNPGYAGRRYYRDNQGLLFFDADLMPRLCVPRSEVPFILSHTHDSAVETAHAGKIVAHPQRQAILA